jgi:hypothetical protein
MLNEEKFNDGLTNNGLTNNGLTGFQTEKIQFEQRF